MRRIRFGFVLAVTLALAADGLAAQQQRTVTGRVLGPAGEPLAGAQVSVVGTPRGTLTSEDGRFSVAVPAGEALLLVQFLGYRSREVAVGASQTAVEVRLESDVLQLEEVVVTGVATGVKRRNLANAVAKVDADELVKAPTASVEQSLQGKIAGASIMQNSGAPGGGVSVRLRGVSSVIGASTPLYVIDGVIASDYAVLPGLNTVNFATGTDAFTSSQENPVNRIADLNPDDIESVEVLKGPSAAAIYGSKAAGGVIMITTKRGRPGQTRFTASQAVGVSTIAEKIGFRRFESVEEAVATFGPLAAQHFRPGAYFDHEEAIFGNTPISYETSVTASGGVQDTRYFASGLVRRENGLVENTFSEKQSVRLNLDQNVGDRFSFSLGTQILRTENDRGLTQNDNSGTSYYGALTGTPTFIDLRRDADGEFPFNPFSGSNPLQTVALFQNSETTWRLVSSGNLTYEAVRGDRHGLRFIVTGGADYFAQKNLVDSPPELQFEPNDGLPGTVVHTDADNLNVNVNGSAVHELTLSNAVATTSVGIQYESRQLDLLRNRAQNLVSGLSIVDAGSVLGATERREEVRDLGFYAQEEVLIGDRLLLTAGVRADRSSNNADPDELFYYPKAAASYRLPLGDGLLNEVKPRLAYGQSGNQPLFGQKFTEILGRNIVGISGFALANPSITAAPDLRPERQAEIEAGIDAVLFDNRATLELTGYQKTITDLLLQRALLPSSGFTFEIRNSGEMRVRGLEAALTADLELGPARWVPRANFSLFRCEVTSLPGGRYRPGGFGTSFGERQLEEGESCTQVIGRDTLADGSAIETKIGDERPDFSLGFANELSWQRLSLYFLWDWQKGGRMLNLDAWIIDAFANSDDYVQGVDGELSGQERFALWPRQTAVYYQDASYLKLREAALTLNVPTSLVHRLWSAPSSVRLSLRGRNLLLFTDYLDGDPEVTQVPGSMAGPGRWDLWDYPPSRSFWLSLDVAF